jgi:hypothetical protein
VAVLNIDMNGTPPLAQMLQRSKSEPRSYPMFSPIMSWMDRFAVTVIMMLAAAPVLAVVADKLIA